MLDSTTIAVKRRLQNRFGAIPFLLQAALALISAFVIWEIVLEFTVLKSPRHLVHPQLGMIFEKGRYLQSSEGFCNTNINSQGMRYNEITPKLINTFRVMALGDSYTEGFAVSDEKTYSALLRQKIAKGNWRPVEVINAGREGGSPVDYVHLADFYRQLVTPDFVIIQLNERDFTHDLFNTSLSYYLVEEKGVFKVKNLNTMRNPLEEFGSRIPQLAPLMGLSTMRILAKKTQPALAEIGDGALFSALNRAPSPISDEDSPAMMIKRAQAIDWVVQRLKAGYPNLVVVFLPAINYSDIENDTPTFCERELTVCCSIAGVPLINMRDDFTAYFIRHHQPANGFANTTPGVGHINEIGHRLTAEKLAVWLKDKDKVQFAGGSN